MGAGRRETGVLRGRDGVVGKDRAPFCQSPGLGWSRLLCEEMEWEKKGLKQWVGVRLQRR